MPTHDATSEIRKQLLLFSFKKLSPNWYTLMFQEKKIRMETFEKGFLVGKPY